MTRAADTIWFQVGLILVIYLYAAASMSILGIVVPLIGPIAASEHVSPGAIGSGLSFFAVPAAMASFLFGMVVDRIGVRRAFVLSIAITIAGDAVAVGVPGVWPFRLGLMLCGAGFAFATSSPPVLFMTYLPEERRAKALAFWSTFSPAGYSGGLLLAIPFLHGGNWGEAFLTHIALMFVVLAVGMAMLRELAPVAQSQLRPGLHGRPSALLVAALGIAVALPNGIAYGTSLIAPGYLARVHHVSLAASSADVALIKIIVMLIGGFIVSLCAGTPRRSRIMFIAMAIVGIAAQIVLLQPTSTIVTASLGLFLWTFAYSGLSGAGMSLLPVVAGEDRNRGAVAGMVGQFISVSSVLVPYVYFSTTLWTSYLLFAALALTGGSIAIMVVRRNGRSVHPREATI